MTDTDWKLLLRRAFGVPNVVSERGAREAIRDALSTMDLTEPTPSAKDIDAIVGGIAGIGQAGNLDGLFLAKSIDFEISGGAKDMASTFGRGSLAEAHIAQRVLAELKIFVESHPFQADCGCYFN
jgi:hypothetical protein